MRIYIPGLLAGFNLNSKSRAWLNKNSHGSDLLCIASNNDGDINRFQLSQEYDGGNIVNFIACCLVGTPDDLEEAWMYDQETDYMSMMFRALSAAVKEHEETTRPPLHKKIVVKSTDGTLVAEFDLPQENGKALTMTQ